MALGNNTALTGLLPALTAYLIMLLLGVLVLLIFFFLGRVAAWILWRFGLHRAQIQKQPLSERRSNTVRSLARSVMDGVSIILAVVFMLSLLIEPGVLVASLSLFSAGLGFAAKNYISDVFQGISLLLNDRIALGDKVEIGERQTMGFVERITLMETHLRGEHGELWVVPNGEIRTIRNLSRGTFSPAHIRLTIPTVELGRGLEALEAVIATPNPDILGTPEIYSQDGLIGQTTVLILDVHARYGAGGASAARY